MPDQFTIAQIVASFIGGGLIVAAGLYFYGIRFWMPGKTRSLSAQIKARDDQLAARDSVIDARDQQIKAKESEIQARDEQIKAKDDHLRAKDEQLKLSKHQLASLTDQITPVLKEHQQATRKLLEEDLASHENVYEVIRDRYNEFGEFIDNLVSARDSVMPEMEELSESETKFLEHIDEILAERTSLGNQLDKFRETLDAIRDERIYGAVTADTIAGAHNVTAQTLHAVGTLANMEAIAKRITAHMPASVKEAVDELAAVISLSPPGMSGMLGGVGGSSLGGAFAAAHGRGGDIGSVLTNLESASINRLLYKVENSSGSGLLPSQDSAFQDVLAEVEKEISSQSSIEVRVDDEDEEGPVAQTA